MNQVFLSGRLPANPKGERLGPAGDLCVRFKLAVERDYRDEDGKRPVDWIDCVAWRHTAEFMHKYLSRGQKILVRGKCRVSRWTTADGKHAKRMEVMVESVEPMGWREQQTEEAAEGADDDSPS